MESNKNTKNTLDIAKIINLANNFSTTEEPVVAIFEFLKDLYAYLNIYKMSVITYNSDMQKYLKLYEYDAEKKIVDHTEELQTDVAQCITMHSTQLLEQKKQMKELCGKEVYFYIKDCQAMKETLQSIGYTPSPEAKEVYIFPSTSKFLHTYCVFEQTEQSPFAVSILKILSFACQMIDLRVNHLIETRKLGVKLNLKNIILQNEEIPIVVVEKDTYQITYFNRIYHEAVAEVQIGMVSESLKKELLPYSDAPIGKEIVIESINTNNHQWIKKAVPVKLSNNREGFMIYSKNNTDYIKELNAVDKLTESILFLGFEEYYKTYVKRNNDSYALCSLDIDKFKYINSTFGYDVGDEVLRSVAMVIRNFIDPQENFCRVSEDKFSILIHYNDDAHLHLKLRGLFLAFGAMRDKRFADAKITIIAGVTLVDKSLPLNVLLDQATMARKSAKGALKSRFAYYNVEVDIQLQKEVQIEEQIPYAIENDEFVPYLQPKFDMRTQKICGAEALVRWITPKGMVFPDQFIPLFEKNGFILSLDFIIYEKVMQQIRSCIDRKMKVYPISVNVSRNHIKDPMFLDKFMALVRKYDIPMKYLELELTESVFVENKEELKTFIDNIKAKGLKVSIDDFGAAYSSLQTLKDVNVDILKIDKGFLDDVHIDKSKRMTKDEILLKNIVRMAKELEFSVICEGVETDEQIAFLKSIGCEMGQGYVFARPMPVLEYEKKFLK
ncbi:MAG: bifunctional diguanylate cyclase/phosphodiesterase [Bacillota bacterium]